MNILEKLNPEKVYPIPHCSIQNETYFQFFTLIFLVIEICSFSSSFVSLITADNSIFVLVLVLRLGLIVSMIKVLAHYLKTNEYGTVFALNYSLIRLVVVVGSMALLIVKSAIWGLFPTVFFPKHKQHKHSFNSTLLALGLFVLSASFCIYLNGLYVLVIWRSKSNKIDADKSDKAHLSEIKSEVTEP